MRKAGPWTIEVVSDREFAVLVQDPERQNPLIADTVLGAGGKLQSMVESSPSLEETYLRLVKGGSA